MGRAGRQPDGKAKTREGKLVAAWSAESRDQEGLPVRDPGSITYSAAIESAATLDTDEYPSEFAERVRREATRRRFAEAQRRGVLADGAIYNWNIAQELFPGATQILDRYVERNRHRMRKEFPALGLCTASNIVESGCHLIFTDRFKHSAMHWSVANKMLAARCYKRSGRFEVFFERRSQRRLAA